MISYWQVSSLSKPLRFLWSYLVDFNNKLIAKGSSQNKILRCNYTTYLVHHLFQEQLQEANVFSCNASEMCFRRKVSHKYKTVQDWASGSFSCMEKYLSFTAYFRKGHLKSCEDAMISLWSGSNLLLGLTQENSNTWASENSCVLPKCFSVSKSWWAQRAPSYPCLHFILTLRNHVECIMQNLALSWSHSLRD